LKIIKDFIQDPFIKLKITYWQNEQIPESAHFLQNPDPEPELEVMDPDLAPERDLNLTKNYKKNQFDNYNIKNTLILHFHYKNALKCHQKTFKIVGIVKE
jgi:hypothetical protein